MATFNKFNKFVQDVAQGVHNLATGTIIVALTDSAPTASSTTIASISQISYTNLSSRSLTTTSATQTNGTLNFILADWVGTATGAVGPFRYVVLYNDTPTSPADPLIGWYDYASEITMAANDTFTVDFDNVNGVLTLV